MELALGLVMTLLLSLLMPTTQHCRRRHHHGRGQPSVCRMYKHKDCRGLMLDTAAYGWSSRSLDRRFNDAISSIVVPPGCCLRVWEHSGFGGRQKTFYPGVHRFLRGDGFWSWGWNDVISSYKCICQRRRA